MDRTSFAELFTHHSQALTDHTPTDSEIDLQYAEYTAVSGANHPNTPNESLSFFIDNDRKLSWEIKLG